MANIKMVFRVMAFFQSCYFCCTHFSRAATQSLPTVFTRHSCVTGWNNAARLLESKAHFWHKVWREAGSPSGGVLHHIKVSSKRRFKYEVRKLKWQQVHIKRKKLAHAFTSSNPINFWKVVNNLNRSRRTPSAPVVDGLHHDAAIADHFSDKLSALQSADNDVS